MKFFPGVPEDHEVLGVEVRDDGETLDVANIDKNDNNTQRTIYVEIYEGYFVMIKLFPRAFINLCKKHPNEPKNIPTDIGIFKNSIGRNFICEGVEDSS